MLPDKLQAAFDAVATKADSAEAAINGAVDAARKAAKAECDAIRKEFDAARASYEAAIEEMKGINKALHKKVAAAKGGANA